MPDLPLAEAGAAPDIYLPITYDAYDNTHIRRPHTTYAGAWKHCEELAAADLTICRFEVATMEMIEDD